ncbi:MAG TPA: hypothetical protein VGC66_15000 [Pyrinomonadaceae bacterium]
MSKQSAAYITWPEKRRRLSRALPLASFKAMSGGHTPAKAGASGDCNDLMKT